MRSRSCFRGRGYDAAVVNVASMDLVTQDDCTRTSWQTSLRREDKKLRPLLSATTGRPCFQRVRQMYNYCSVSSQEMQAGGCCTPDLQGRPQLQQLVVVQRDAWQREVDYVGPATEIFAGHRCGAPSDHNETKAIF